MKKNLAVGHFYNEPFTPAIERHLGRVAEVFFAWPGVLSCRPAPTFTPEVEERLYSDLSWCRAHGVRLDTLFNANCYGDASISTELADFVRRVLGDMDSKGLLPDTVTTTSPFIATVLRRDFPSIERRASVNVRIDGTTGFEHVSDLFDSFYISRDFQRDLSFVRANGVWARAHGVKLGMQVNSGCLRECPFQQFHDNLHGHGDGRAPAQTAAAKEFDFNFFLCKSHYGRNHGFEDFLRATWIRPEDVPLFEDDISVFKIATRRVSNPTEILDAYAEYSYDGNLLRLMDPDHSALFAPLELQNKRFPPDWATSGIGAACAQNCTHCGRCAAVFREICAPPAR